jgi:hypothetical protein
VDDKLGREDFGTAVDNWIGRHAVGDSTRNGYRVTARAWVKPTFAGQTLAQVAGDRDRVTDLLVRDMGHLSITRSRQARTIITGTIGEAVKAGKLAKHNLHDIDLKDNGRATERSDFVRVGIAVAHPDSEHPGVAASTQVRGASVRVFARSSLRMPATISVMAPIAAPDRNVTMMRREMTRVMWITPVPVFRSCLVTATVGRQGGSIQ